MEFVNEGDRAGECVKALSRTRPTAGRAVLCLDEDQGPKCEISAAPEQTSCEATLAQLVERLIRNQQVASSILAGGSIFSSGYGHESVRFDRAVVTTVVTGFRLGSVSEDT
jgi:hypothetical protein